MGLITTKTGVCPRCGVEVCYEPVEFLPLVVPVCDACDRLQAECWAIGEERRKWRALYRTRIPQGYGSATADKVKPCFSSLLTWSPESHHGGAGLIGDSGAGKSSAVAVRLFALEMPFKWWSGTEARDAAIEAATADRDREGARQRWESAMRTPLLVLDDISQGKMTEAWSSKLFDLLETRLSSNLATIWTSQIPLDALREKIVKQNFGDVAQAEAISRRLSQHSLILKA